MEDVKEVDIETPQDEIKLQKDKEIKTQNEKISVKPKEFKTETPNSKIGLREQKIIIKERKEKVFNFLKQRKVWVFGLLIVALILGIYIRSLPMQVRPETGKPGLWDIATNDWTLGPDLDPWLFTRYAKTIVEQGGLPDVDRMRNVPLGFETAKETRLLSYMIVVVHNIVNLFDNYSINFSAALFPVIMFALTIIAFFLFVREIFVRKSERSKTKANIIALISTFFMIVIPVFLSRTLAGIPEKESAGFFFMFIAFYFFLKAWKSDILKIGIIFGVLAGISTGLMGLVWGGVVYVFVAIAVATLIAFVLGIIHKKEFYIYFSWIFLSFFILIVFSNQISAGTLVSSLDTGLAFLVLFILLIDYILWNTKINRIKFLQQRKIPKNILSLIIAVIFGVILSSIFFGPGFLIEKIKYLNQILFKPVVGRWNITVAENRQPFFTEWSASFGPFLKNIPVLFWLFFIGSVVLFKKMLSKIKKEEAWVLTGLYILFFFGLVFSRYSSSSIFNGESFISKLFYYGSALLLIGVIIYYYSKDHQENTGYKKIRYEYIFLFSLFALCLFTARSAVRLIMVLGPIAPIFLGFLIVDGVEKFRQIREGIMKIIIGVFLILIILLSLYIFFNDYGDIKINSRGMIPSYYNQQWQKAMSWVRQNTDENAVFAHWWDYGYWLQSIGERATVLDGGNLITYWNYLMGRHVLTGDNQDDALEFLYNHNATHFLIDSSDIGKYGAFSGIGSDENFDRYSFIPAGVMDNNQVQETSEGLIRVYQIGAGTDEDIIYEQNESKIFLPGGRTGLGGVIVDSVEQNGSITFKQPSGVFFYNNQQYTFKIRYLYFNGEFYDFESGINGTAYIIPRLFADRIDNLGALIYISPRVMRGYLAQKYLLDDPFNKFPNFKTEYVESSLIVNNIRAQGMGVGEFIYYGGVQGPIKIWGIQYTGKEEIKEEYLDTNPNKYISWEL